MPTLVDRCVKQYNGILEVRAGLAEIEQKKEKLMALSSTQITVAELAIQENKVGVNVDTNS